MKVVGWLFVLFAQITQAGAQAPAKLRLSMTEEDSRTEIELKTPLRSGDGEYEDPWLCRRVEQRLQHLERVERQIQALLQKLALDGRTPGFQEMQELELLEQRRLESANFLSRSAPTKEAIWEIGELPPKVWESLQEGRFLYSIKSFALIWEHVDGRNHMPPERAVWYWSSNPYRLKLVLRGDVLGFCSRQEVELRIVLKTELELD